MKILYELHDLHIAVDDSDRKYIFIWNKDATKIKLLGKANGSKNIFDMIDNCDQYSSFRRRINKRTSLEYRSLDQSKYRDEIKDISIPLFECVGKTNYTPEEVILLEDVLNDLSLIDDVVAQRNNEEISNGREF